jgi:hypothetical protein
MMNKDKNIFTSHPLYRFVACEFCIHNIDGKSCNAFPSGIPIQILTGENKHREVLPEQANKLIFEQIVYQEAEKA